MYAMGDDNVWNALSLSPVNKQTSVRRSKFPMGHEFDALDFAAW